VQDPFVVAFVVGVTPSKWARIWGERMARPLELRPLPRDAALAALADGSAHVALVRLADDGLAQVALPAEFSAIALYTENAVVIAPKDHPVTAFESLTLADLAGEKVLGEALLGEAVLGGAVRSEAGLGGAVRSEAVLGGALLGEAGLGGAVRSEAELGGALWGEAVLGRALLGEAVRGEAVLGEAVRGEAGGDTEPDWAGLISLVAANVGVAIMPQPVARALSRRDVVATPITATLETRIALVWVTARQIPETEEFIGIVRGRTANSSRGAGESGAGGASSGEAGSGGAGSSGAGSGGAGSGGAGGQQPKGSKASSSRSATPSRRDPRASRARRR